VFVVESTQSFRTGGTRRTVETLMRSVCERTPGSTVGVLFVNAGGGL
jgi:hypothetical protein